MTWIKCGKCGEYCFTNLRFFFEGPAPDCGCDDYSPTNVMVPDNILVVMREEKYVHPLNVVIE